MEVSTKERILQEALKLFARNGYMATSMNDIAKRLEISKAALYKHYASKQEILDSIVERMNQMDEERMKTYEMPGGTFQQMAEGYQSTPYEKIRMFSEIQFRHWTEEEFACDFRRILTLEQYRSKEFGALYQQYLGEGPISYMASLFGEMLKAAGNADVNPRQIALDFYGPIYLLISMYDMAENKEELVALLLEHVDRFSESLRIIMEQ